MSKLRPFLSKEQFRFTLCFLTRDDQVLMMYRNYPPNQGMWNGVGGRIEPGERVVASCRREVEEETGFHLTHLHFAGLLSWDGFEIEAGGLFIFTADAPAGDPVGSEEGVLAWKKMEWVVRSPVVVSNLHIALPRVLRGDKPCHNHFEYNNGKMIGQHIFMIPEWVGSVLQ